MSARFDWCVAKVIEDEGGSALTDNPNDPGRLTRYGISARAHPDVDIRNLTLEQAVAIYRRDYWDAARCDQLPQPFDYLVFDFAVNSGVRRAAAVLQRFCDVRIDGEIGTITINALWNRHGPNLVSKYLLARLRYLESLPTYEQFGDGWTMRLFRVAAARQPTGEGNE